MAETPLTDIERHGPCTECGVAAGIMRPQLCFECWRQDHPAFTPWHKRRTVRRHAKRAFALFLTFTLWTLIVASLR